MAQPNSTYPLIESSTENLDLSHGKPPGEVEFWMTGEEGPEDSNDAFHEPNYITNVYAVYNAPCNNSGALIPWQFEMRTKFPAWKALKATFSVCLQTLNTTVFNSTTQTTLVSQSAIDDPTWMPGRSNTSNSSSIYKDQYSIDTTIMIGMRQQINFIFNGTGYWMMDTLALWSSAPMRDLGQAIYGLSPFTCVEPTPNSGLGIYGFERIMNNTAIALTNT
jgi:hypothetical protein